MNTNHFKAHANPISKPLKKKSILNFLSKYFPFLEYYLTQKEKIPFLDELYVIKIHFKFKPFF